MARKTRMEETSGLYHVLNRGNCRDWIFREEGAKDAFEARTESKGSMINTNSH
jgi:putative transposase